MTFVSDQPGPDHAPEVVELGIQGVLIESFPSVAYRHGALVEVVNGRWQDIYAQPVEHLYFISNPDAIAREEWYVHHKVTDRYLIIEGHVDVALYDDRATSATVGELLVVELRGIGQDGFSGLLIPNGVWHSFSSRADKLLLMNAKVPGYNRNEPDKHRMPMPNDKVDFHWGLQT